MPSHNFPLVAIVGQPNAGKSTLLNKIAGKPLAVTSDVAGTTRDRQYIDTAWNGKSFTLVDTAGLSLNVKDQLELSLLKQIDIAVAEADVILFLVDGKQSKAAVEEITLQKFRRLKKPLALVVNKLDSARIHDEKLVEFQKLGIKPIFCISALTGLGTGDLLDYIVTKLPESEAADEVASESSIAVAIVGKPNVGKSSIFNAILKEERVVVSPVAGTTRTAIDSQIKINGVNYTFIDTAGLKKKEYRQAQPDIFSGFQTFKAIRRSDVCLFILDPSEEMTKQDQRVASEIFNMEKGCVVLANKSDLLAPSQKGGISRSSAMRGGGKKTSDDYQDLRDSISLHFPFLWMSPIFFVSALTGQGLAEAVATLKPIYERRHKRIGQETLDAFLGKMMKRNPPKLLRDQKKPKVFGLRQFDTNPPKFELLVNHPAAISTQFRKFVENGIIRDLDFYGTPITLRLQGKDKS